MSLNSRLESNLMSEVPLNVSVGGRGVRHLDGESGASARVAIELGQDRACGAHTVSK